MNNALVDYIHEHWDCLSYARDVLGLPVSKDGDRCVSFRPGAKNPTSLIINREHWHDFGSDEGGDVIDLCAQARHNGDKGAAFRELGGDFYQHKDTHAWIDYTQKLASNIALWQKNLRPEHREYLHSRRISDDTIERLRIGYHSGLERIVIPYFKNNNPVYWAGRTVHPVTPDNPKYFKAKIDDFNENVPWGLHTISKEFDALHEPYAYSTDHQMADRRGVLVIAEGMFDAMSFEQEGWHVLSPIGGYFSKNQLRTVLNIAKLHKYVFVCFDSDNAGNKFLLKMSKILFTHHIKFMAGHLPAGVKDVSDYYAAGGNITDLITGRTSGLQVLANSFTEKDEFAEFCRSASRFVSKSELIDCIEYAMQKYGSKYCAALLTDCYKSPAEQLIINEVLNDHNLKYIEGGGFFEYSHGIWRRTPDNVIKNYVSDALGLYATGAKLSSIIGHLKAKISSQEEFNTHDCFNFLNGTLNLTTGKLEEHSPGFMSTTQAHFSYDPDAKCPLFTRFIADIMDNDTKKIALVQEMAGYILFPDCRLQKCFFLMGDGGNGKSVLINVLTQIFGDENCSSVELSNLAGPFDPIRLRYSLVNFSSETKTHIKEAEARFKAVVTGDKISAAFKGMDAVEFAPRCKMICAANAYISTNDFSHGLLRRLCFIKFTKTYSSKNADKHLTEKLLDEKPGIFNWIYRGYLRLIEQGEFTQTDEQSDLQDDFLLSINPMAAFIQEEISKIHSGEFSTKELYAMYATWAKEAGCQPLNRINFSRTFKSLIKQLRPNTRAKKLHGYMYFEFVTANITEGI